MDVSVKYLLVLSLLFLLFLATEQASSGGSRERKDNAMSLKSVDRELGKIRETIGGGSLRLENINNYLLEVLKAMGSFEGRYLPLMVRAIKKRRYGVLKSLYPVTTMSWWRDGDDLAIILTMALGCDGWMSEAEWREWMSGEEWKVHRMTAEWGLRFRDLIRSKNAIVYED